MAPRKLSDSDKSEIIELYKQPDQTTTTLAGQYGVSNSTISRILKNSLPPEEYSELISQKRMAGAADKSDIPARQRRSRQKDRADAPDLADAAKASVALEPEEASPSKVAPPKLKIDTSPDPDQATEATSKETSSRRRRRRSKSEDDDGQLPLLTTPDEDTEDSAIAETSASAAHESQPAKVAAPILANSDSEEEDDDDDLEGLDETLGDDFGDDDDDELEDDDDDDDIDIPRPKLQATAVMQIMPLGEAILPKPCYLVVDMRSELITRPLSEFADLGQVPSTEEKAKTLPVFDNHRVARRFSRNKQRVIKVPDGSLITRTSPYLKAKGITRLLVDGQVFDLV
ncbi:MAG: hypothetical protein WA885_00635 [Phormidesmis sp.]